MTLRLDPALHEWLRGQAHRTGTPIQGVVTEILTAAYRSRCGAVGSPPWPEAPLPICYLLPHDGGTPHRAVVRGHAIIWRTTDTGHTFVSGLTEGEPNHARD